MPCSYKFDFFFSSATTCSVFILIFSCSSWMMSFICFLSSNGWHNKHRSNDKAILVDRVLVIKVAISQINGDWSFFFWILIFYQNSCIKMWKCLSPGKTRKVVKSQEPYRLSKAKIFFPTLEHLPPFIEAWNIMIYRMLTLGSFWTWVSTLRGGVLCYEQ